MEVSMEKSLTRVWLVALCIAWCFDVLFWKKEPGISFAVFVFLVVSGGLAVSLFEKRHPPFTSLLLLLPAGFFAVMTFIRMEPLTTFVNVLLTLVFLAILASTFLSGRWYQYSWVDYAIRMFRLGISTASKPIVEWDKHLKDRSIQSPPRNAQRGRAILPVIRGILLALPALLIFGALLASADPIFGQGIEDFFAIFNIENLPEYLFRLAYILIGGYMLVGVYLHALSTSRDEQLIGLDKPVIPRFLGFTEAVIVLGSVISLFALFVVVQIRYFFGGQGNIHIDGYTYSEYARRGFAELVLVAFFTLLLLLTLNSVAKRVSRSQRITFSTLGIALTVLVGVILVSAYQRLLLYEAAYGFTRLRAYTHIFMVWLGVLLAALMLLELLGRLRAFALVSLLVAAGFGITLDLLPVDSLIARQNIQRALLSSELDTQYLVTLYPDAVGSIWQQFNDPGLDSVTREQLGGILACQAAINPPEDRPWQSFHLSRYQAEALLTSASTDLERFNARQDVHGNWTVTVEGQDLDCSSTGWID
jgi:hypothetical protein